MNFDHFFGIPELVTMQSLDQRKESKETSATRVAKSLERQTLALDRYQQTKVSYGKIFHEIDQMARRKPVLWLEHVLNFVFARTRASRMIFHVVLKHAQKNQQIMNLPYVYILRYPSFLYSSDDDSQMELEDISFRSSVFNVHETKKIWKSRLLDALKIIYGDLVNAAEKLYLETSGEFASLMANAKVSAEKNKRKSSIIKYRKASSAMIAVRFLVSCRSVVQFDYSASKIFTTDYMTQNDALAVKRKCIRNAFQVMVFRPQFPNDILNVIYSFLSFDTEFLSQTPKMV